MRNFIIFISVYSMFACNSTTAPASRNFSNTPTSSIFAEGVKTGEIQGKFVKELSGIAASRQLPGGYWVHADGIKASEIYLIDTLGNRLATCQLPGVATQDCEDIAIGAGPQAGVTYIYLADIGDNDAVFPEHTIFRIPEPTMPATDAPKPFNITASNPEKLRFNYPGGERLNAETLLLDPVTRDLYIFTKAPDNGVLFRFPYPQSTTDLTTLERICELPIEKATAGDISPNGTEILLKNKKEIFYWKAKNGERPGVLLQKNNPERIPYLPEIQGEAVCFNLHASGFLTSTERKGDNPQAIFFYKRR